MPKLIFFLPCEKAIVNQGDNSLSLINVIQGINVPKPPVEDAGAVISWHAVSFWKRTSDDTNKAYEQRTCLSSPNGKDTAESIVKFDFSGQPNQRNIVRVNGFPVGQPGIYILKLFLREFGSESWAQVADYQITVTHIAGEAVKNEK